MRLLILSLIGFALIAPACADQSLAPRERISFNKDWFFFKGDPVATTNSLNYDKNPAVKQAVIASTLPAGLSDDQKKLGTQIASTQPSFDDAGWRKLNLPHDWAIEGPFDQKIPGELGKLPFVGPGWYRKHFILPASTVGKKVSLEIDGAMSHCLVWCNGQLVGGWPYGYNSFRLDLTPYLKAGAENVLSIRLENPDDSSRWYPGAGIYRNVWLVTTDPIHVAHWGTTVTTPDPTKEQAKVVFKAEIVNETAKQVQATVSTELLYQGESVGKIAVQSLSIPANEKITAEGSTTLSNPQLWDTEHPNLYRAVTTVMQDGKVTDCYETPFGIRTIKFTADNGFLLNGKRLQLQGVCNHHDLGALGAAFNERAAQRQLEILKEMGFNALRTSHNMPAPELLDLCDRMGIVVMDESFDCWNIGKKGGDYHNLWGDWHEKDLRSEVRRDRNHPSVILWSLGNEIPGQGKAEAIPIFKELITIAHEEDPTRPTTLGANNIERFTPEFTALFDVAGENYDPGMYNNFHKEKGYPSMPLFGSETASTVSTRGEYFFDTPEAYEARYAGDVKNARAHGKPVPKKPVFKPVPEDKSAGQQNFQMSSYDLYHPGWATLPDQEFAALELNPSVAGEFVWTGFDYLGEPTPYNSDMSNLLNFRNDSAKQAEMKKQLKELGKIPVPSRSSYFGIIDLAGFKKDRFYLYQAHWRPDFPMAHILPHWNWPERVGQVTPVYVYTSGDEAELFLNGKSLGRKKKNPQEYRIHWDDAVYQPGELKVIAYKDGKEWATDLVKTTGSAAKLLLTPDRDLITADGKDLSFVTVTVADKDELMVPKSKNLVKFELSGPGEIVAVDNGDPTSFESFQAHQRKAFNGLALVVIRSKEGASGAITLKATSEGLTPAELKITGK